MKTFFINVITLKKNVLSNSCLNFVIFLSYKKKKIITSKTRFKNIKVFYSYDCPITYCYYYIFPKCTYYTFQTVFVQKKILIIRNTSKIAQKCNILLNFNYDYFILYNRYGLIHFILCKQDIQTIAVHVEALFVS